MITELKIRIKDLDEVKAKLKQAGAKFLKDENFRYVYFNQPRGKVLKLTETGGKTYKTVLEAEDGRWVFKFRKELANSDGVLAELTKKFGVKKELTNHQKSYRLDDQMVCINHFEGLGYFLIIMSDDPKLEFVTERLGIKNPEVITDSFDNL